jgi:hypothetical protein
MYLYGLSATDKERNMSSPDNNSSDFRNSQEDFPASRRFIPVSREDSLEVPREELVMVRKQDLERYKHDLERLEIQHRQELERITKQTRQDLERIARRIEAELRPRAEYLQSLAGTLFGIGAGTAGSIPQFLTAPTLSNWVIPTYAVSAISLCLLSLVFIFIDRNLRRTRKENALNIAQEIRDLVGTESSYRIGTKDAGRPGSRQLRPKPNPRSAGNGDRGAA